MNRATAYNRDHLSGGVSVGCRCTLPQPFEATSCDVTHALPGASSHEPSTPIHQRVGGDWCHCSHARGQAAEATPLWLLNCAQLQSLRQGRIRWSRGTGAAAARVPPFDSASRRPSGGVEKGAAGAAHGSNPLSLLGFFAEGHYPSAKPFRPTSKSDRDLTTT